MGGNIPPCPAARFLNSSYHNYRKFASLTVTCKDAKAYMYSLSSKRRVHKWTDIQVNLYI